MQKECFEVVNERVHPKRAFPAPARECSGSEREPADWWMAQGKVESTNPPVFGLPRRSHPREEADAVQQMRDKQAQVDVVIRKLWDWLGLVGIT